MPDETFQSHVKTFVDRTLWSQTFWSSAASLIVTLVALWGSDLQQFLSASTLLKLTVLCNLYTMWRRSRTDSVGSIKPSITPS